MRPRSARPWWTRARAAGFLASIHTAPFVALATGIVARDWIIFAVLYLSGAFAVGVGLHRYFSHRAFQTSRTFQFMLGVLACTTFTDPISFAGKHRLHHKHSDTELDVHSPRAGLWFCWLGSIIDEGYPDAVLRAHARDLARFPELVWLHRYFWLPGVVLGAAVWLLWGFSAFAIGFCLSRALVMHGASVVNFFCHRFGSRRFATRDDSRNNALVALLTLGEGWHNNHHHYPAAARAGFFWWELDVFYLTIRLLARFGLVWNVREVPIWALATRRVC